MMQISGVISDGLVILPSSGGFRSLDFKSFPPFYDTKSLLSGGILKRYPSCFLRLGAGLEKCRTRSLSVRASGHSNNDTTPIAPLRFESPVGQLLVQIMQTHPHLLPAAIDQQLENLQTDQGAQGEESLPPQNDLLYRRIAEVQEKERRKALEEIIYCLIVQKFMENAISMIPPISVPSSDPTGRVDLWPNQEQKLESVHSPEAFEMIQSHLSLVLGDRLVGPLDTIVQISKLKLGKLYAASIMYGYFLKRVDQRFQLERTMKTLPDGFDEDQVLKDPAPENQLWDADSLIRISPDDGDSDGDGDILGSGETKSYRLRSYVMYLDAETLQRYATVRTKEAISLIEKQTQALFGRPDIRIAEDGSLDTSNDEMIGLTFSGLTMLVLEAVAFGSFLWDAESYVESKDESVTS
ncbi:PREDICTED: UV-B-induced protein At3g17800, chloroplastic [Nelumbo nucifera]|uniref:UV-B-induced protein At3g17800, chloroplastic n=1 Tax=Nelumbo nucifera TaxID=4432 RepID=A0A1U8A8V7_NELNU|nr:PREDICTED: UV-B-induced protein At3g17800, chloroplastic [Nelumbo nucifera]